MLNACVVQFTKTPQLGAVKTRMQPYLTLQQSCHLHDALTRQVLSNLYSPRWGYRLFWAGLDDRAWRDDVLSDFNLTGSHESAAPVRVYQQQGTDLGARMANAFTATLEAYRSVVLVGSDCPSLTQACVGQALEALEEGEDICFVSAEDGGYVLVAMRAAELGVFEGIDWGTERVLAQSLAAAEKLGLRVRVLPSLPDIDRPEDLYHLSAFDWAAPFLELLSTG